MSYLVTISDKHFSQDKAGLLADFTHISQVLINEFGFEIQTNEDGSLEFFYHNDFPENILGYEDSVLWTKNPTDDFLQMMINISNKIEGSKVIGDEGEWYVSLNEIRYSDSEPELKTNAFLEYLKAWTPAVILLFIFFILKKFLNA